MIDDVDRSAFERDGYVYLGPLVSGRELDELRRRLDRHLRDASGQPSEGVRDLSERRGKPLSYAILQLVNVWQRDPVFADLARRPDIVDAMTEILGRELRLFRDQAFYKPPAADGELYLHQDNRYWHLDPPEAATLWLALDDATVENACTSSPGVTCSAECSTNVPPTERRSCWRHALTRAMRSPSRSQRATQLCIIARRSTGLLRTERRGLGVRTRSFTRQPMYVREASRSTTPRWSERSNLPDRYRPMTRYHTLLYETDEAAAWVTLNRPKALNAMTEQMHHELRDAIDRAGSDESIHALVITGAGEQAFCIGSDLAFLDEALQPDGLPVFAEYLRRLAGLFFALEDCPLPTIAMVNGRARASGFELIMACDFVTIAAEAIIGDVHTPYAHMPGAGALQRTVRKIGLQQALHLTWTGRWLTAKESVETGIALLEVPRDALRGETAELVADLADKPRECLAAIKRAAMAGLDLPLRDAVAREAAEYVHYLSTSSAGLEAYARHRRGRAVAKPLPAAT
jgi:enoyl-CoA hydratase/carnithine racemase